MPDTKDPPNLPGFKLGQSFVDVWGKLLGSNLDSCNSLWKEMKEGDVTLKSILKHYVGTVDRYWTDLGQLVRTPFVDTDRPDWAIFWWDLDSQRGPMFTTVTLGRRHPGVELHQSALQKLGQDYKIGAEHYNAELVEEGGALTVTLKSIPENAEEGDYVGLVTAQALTAPLAVVMVTVRRGT